MSNEIADYDPFESDYPTNYDAYPVKTPANDVDDLNLTVRAYNILKREGINTVAQLASMTEQEVSSLRNIGMKAVENIKEQLGKAGYTFKYPRPYVDDVVHEQINVWHCGSLTVTVAADGTVTLSKAMMSPQEFRHLRKIIAQIEEPAEEAEEETDDDRS